MYYISKYVVGNNNSYGEEGEEGCIVQTSGPEIIKLFSCSTQLSARYNKHENTLVYRKSVSLWNFLTLACMMGLATRQKNLRLVFRLSILM